MSLTKLGKVLREKNVLDAEIKPNRRLSHILGLELPPLLEAIVTRDLRKVESALHLSNKIDQKDTKGNTGLMYAARQSDMEIAKYLLGKDAKLQIKNDNGGNALSISCKKGDYEMAEMFATSTLQIAKPQTKFSVGVEYRQATDSEARRLLNTKDNEGCTALMRAAGSGSLEIMKMLIGKGAGVKVKDDEGWDLLMWGCVSGKIEVVEYLITEHLLSAQYLTEKGETALMKAAGYGFNDIVSLLLDEKAKVNQVDMHQQGAVMWAICQNHLETVKLLVLRGAHLDKAVKNGQNVVHIAAAYGYVKILEFVLSKMSSKYIDAQDDNCETPLFFATRSGNRDTVELLLTKGCKIDAVNLKGETALMNAAKNGVSLPIIALLIDRGSNIHRTNDSVQNVLDLAESSMNLETVNYLRKIFQDNPCGEE